MHRWSGNWVTIVSAVVYYARAAYAFNAGTRCRHCILHLYHTSIIFELILQSYFSVLNFGQIHLYLYNFVKRFYIK